MIPVAGYCRVSTDREDQNNSFQAQQRYFREYIETHPEWTLCDIYADEGITGTSTRKRTQFNRMINDAYRGRFRMIVTKEVSRFSRNILDTIRYTRELKRLGIGVIFATDRINTLEPEGEMLLCFLASLAQEESRRTSSRVVWGQTRQMERGVVFGQSLLGYDVKNGVMTVNQQGAEIVRLIFHKYGVEQAGASEIARYLTEAGYQTHRGSPQWTAGTIIRILKNEKYVGDLIQRKSYTPDYLTHEKKRNRGQVPLVILENHHAPIISREVWNITQQRLQKNNKHGNGDGGHSNRYGFSGKIRCGECGSSFVGRFRYRKDGAKIRRWCCGKAAREGTAACSVGKLVTDEAAHQMLYTALRSLPMDVKAIIANVGELAREAILEDHAGLQKDLQRMKKEIQGIQQKKEAMLDSYFSGKITDADLDSMGRHYDSQLQALYQRQKDASCSAPEACVSEYAIEKTVSDILAGKIPSQVFCKSMVDTLTVFQDRHMELRLKDLPQVFYFTE